MAPRVTHVVFDMDDVLAVRSTEATCAALAESSGLSSEVVMERLYLPADTSWDEGADAGKGMATGDEFIRLLNAQLQGSRAVTREDWIAARRAGMEPTPEVLALARAIRDGGQATLVLLTNNNPLLAEELPAIYPEVAQLFAPYAWCSSMFGTSKPDPMVFERVALALGAHPSSLYFIDDSAANIAAAEHAGLRGAFHFTGDVSALRAVLQDVGALPAAATLSADQLTVGLLTGVSYVSGIDYYTQINEGVALALASGDDIAGGHSSKMVAYSADLEEYVGRLTVAEEVDDYSDVAVWFADMVERYLSGADFVVIASNTVHLAVDEIERRPWLPPVLHIADTVAASCRERGFTKLGLVGTPHTMKQTWLLGRLRAHGLEVLVPESVDDMTEMYRIICDELSHTPIITDSRDWMVGQIRQLATRGAMAVVLGCTEIELLVQQEHVEDVPVIYSGALHIEAAIEVQTNRRSIDEFLPPRQHLSGSPAAPQASL